MRNSYPSWVIYSYVCRCVGLVWYHLPHIWGCSFLLTAHQVWLSIWPLSTTKQGVNISCRGCAVAEVLLAACHARHCHCFHRAHTDWWLLGSCARRARTHTCAPCSPGRRAHCSAHARSSARGSTFQTRWHWHNMRYTEVLLFTHEHKPTCSELQ